MSDAKNKKLEATMIGRMIVEQSLATSDEVKTCMALWENLEKGDKTAARLSELLVSNQVITNRQLERVMVAAENQGGQQQIPGYQMMNKLGEGAMAKVYSAKQISLDRVVAIKVLPKKFMSDPTFVERFYAEGRAAAKLNHANIVQAYDVNQAGDFHYFVMEYVEGETVHDYLERHKQYSEEDAVQIMIEMADALGHAHEKGFMHRDVKPRNIIITKAGVSKLADMGLARQVSDSEAAKEEKGKAFGTPYYISPEQIRGKVDVDYRADIYGLGATFYHMVTGRVPFDGDSPTSVMGKHLKTPVVPPDHINTKLSAGVSEIIEVMLAKNPDKRYQSALDLLEDLRLVQNGEAPAQARKQVDMSMLSSMEESVGEMAPKRLETGPSLLENPLFWFAVLSVIGNLVLLVALVS